MKFQVLVGEDFPCNVAEVSPSPAVVVNVHQPVHDKPHKKLSGAVLAIGAVVIFGATVPATVYGFATGDFSALKSIATSTRDLFEVSMKMLK